VPGDFLLIGKTRGDFTCVTYRSPQTKKQIWTTGWLPSAALTPVAPLSVPQPSDWIGTWGHPGGSIEIRRGARGKLRIRGEMIVPGAQDVHTGAIEAHVAPGKASIAFADDGSIPFEKTEEGGCQARMQRIQAWRLVEDNDGCGGAGVTFTGLYRRGH
jgi:hypothetical protein